ncbi:hypothetical protein QJS04_geneDACA006940 [Acorus gramineus]|uniref:Mitochondrial import receptor subunit TOM5 homolog n=1 Tax=Acorus gramineus TaxID=55184 RepID=A0AAV9AYR8_ACOGR|nr:hypothetical protein QJS04_geneDACA006940 [Acorus gramineus]
MAKSSFSVANVKEFLNSQYQDEEKWKMNAKLLRTMGFFVGSIFIMRNFGDLMAI